MSDAMPARFLALRLAPPAFLVLVLACSDSSGPHPVPPVPTAIHKIQHVIIIMQENRSFDSYFGTFPGAEGIPMMAGAPAVCAPDPELGSCVRPYHDPADKNFGGPPTHGDA